MLLIKIQLSGQKRTPLVSEEVKKGATGQLFPQVGGYANYSRLSDPAVVVPIKSFGGTTPIFRRDHYKTGLTIKITLY